VKGREEKGENDLKHPNSWLRHCYTHIVVELLQLTSGQLSWLGLQLIVGHLGKRRCVDNCRPIQSTADASSCSVHPSMQDWRVDARLQGACT